MEFIEVPASTISLSKRGLVYGVGVNDADYITETRGKGRSRSVCPYYMVWRNMLKRCYCESYIEKNPAYMDCVVSVEWRLFSVFKGWMTLQDWRGKALDKDLFSDGVKTYSSSTCVFLDRHINNLIVSGEDRGVHFDKSRLSYIVCVGSGGDGVLSSYVGRYKIKSDAISAYKEAKSKVIRRIANEQKDIKIKTALLKKAESI